MSSAIAKRTLRAQCATAARFAKHEGDFVVLICADGPDAQIEDLFSELLAHDLRLLPELIEDRFLLSHQTSAHDAQSVIDQVETAYSLKASAEVAVNLALFSPAGKPLHARHLVGGSFAEELASEETAPLSIAA